MFVDSNVFEDLEKLTQQCSIKIDFQVIKNVRDD